MRLSEPAPRVWVSSCCLCRGCRARRWIRRLSYGKYVPRLTSAAESGQYRSTDRGYPPQPALGNDGRRTPGRSGGHARRDRLAVGGAVGRHPFDPTGYGLVAAAACPLVVRRVWPACKTAAKAVGFDCLPAYVQLERRCASHGSRAGEAGRDHGGRKALRDRRRPHGITRPAGRRSVRTVAVRDGHHREDQIGPALRPVRARGQPPPARRS